MKENRRFIILHRDGNLAIFTSLTKASDYLGISRNTLAPKKFPFVFRGVYFDRVHIGDGNGIVADPKTASRDFVVSLKKPT